MYTIISIYNTYKGILPKRIIVDGVHIRVTRVRCLCSVVRSDEVFFFIRKVGLRLRTVRIRYICAE